MPRPPTTRRSLKLGCLLIALAALLAFFAPMYLGLREAFFSPPVDLSGEKFDAAHLAHVAAESGIVFPSGTVGLEYHYRHVQDPYGLAKLSVPADKVETMLARAKIVPAPRFVPAADPGLAWWHPETLAQARELSGEGRGGRAVRCVVGVEAGQTVVYVAWFNFLERLAPPAP